jgi:hypothetical protein
MARGWESKAVENQVEAAATRMERAPERSPQAEIEKRRQRESVLLSRRRVLEDLREVKNPRYEKMLRDALAHLDAKLAELE